MVSTARSEPARSSDGGSVNWLATAFASRPSGALASVLLAPADSTLATSVPPRSRQASTPAMPRRFDWYQFFILLAGEGEGEAACILREAPLLLPVPKVI